MLLRYWVGSMKNNYKDRILLYLIQNTKNSKGKFNIREISKYLDIPFKDVVTVINELQKKNLINIQCPKYSNK